MLLKHLDLEKKELISMHSYTDEKKLSSVIDRLENGEHLALVSDAGTPGISDPGFKLVNEATNRGIKSEVLPGPSAFLAALSASGLPINHFTYYGFLPLKKGRKTLLESIRDSDHTIVFYESVHRIERTLKEFAELLKDTPNRPILIARELTKIHEEVVRTTAVELGEVAESVVKKGEFVVVVGK